MHEATSRYDKAPGRAPKSNPEYVDIYINYLDAVSGQPIYTGFAAQIQYGTSYSNTVISPTYLGYAPFYNAADPSGGTVDANDDATVVALNIPADYTAAQYVVNVYYKAIDVPYAVRYYFQNINDDMYTENMGLYRISSAKTGTIISNEQLEVQQINKAAMRIMNIPDGCSVLGEPVVRLLDPLDFLSVLNTGKSIRDKRVYLADYKKYVEETVIMDHSFHIIMCIMRDITMQEQERQKKEELGRQTVEITDKVVDKQMRVVQEIASLLGETAAETKIALTKLKESLRDE